jgi:hypothetical protein
VKPLSKSINSPFTFPQLFDASGALWPNGLRSRVDAHYSNATSGAVFGSFWKHFVRSPSPLNVFLYAIFTEELMSLIKPHIHGYYIGESDTIGHPEYYKKAFSGRNLEELTELRKKHDPTGVFFAPGEGIS